jgi:hypothetical protein
MKIATWNINGVKARLEGALTWLKETSPDVACFQEIKSVTEGFPGSAFEEIGYNVAVHGQKASTASPSSPSAPSTRWSSRACRAMTETRTPATSKCSFHLAAA